MFDLHVAMVWSMYIPFMQTSSIAYSERDRLITD